MFDKWKVAPAKLYVILLKYKYMGFNLSDTIVFDTQGYSQGKKYIATQGELHRL